MNNQKVYEDLTTPFHKIFTFPNGNSIFLGSQSAVGGFPDKWNYSQKDYDNVFKELKKNNIKYVVCCAELYDLFDKIEYLHIPMESNDNFDINESISKSFKFIDDRISKASVLVHCNAGCHRSATVVTYYMMKKMNWSVDKTHNFIKEKRSCVNIDNFRSKLLKINM